METGLMIIELLISIAISLIGVAFLKYKKITNGIRIIILLLLIITIRLGKNY